MSAVDRLFAALGYCFHSAFSRTLPESATLARDVARHAQRYGPAPAAEHIAQLRYRLRRDGFGPDLVAECLGLYSAQVEGAPAALALAAACRLAHGAVVEIPGAADRRHALVCAALMRALHGDQVHLLSPNEGSAKSLYALVQPVFSRLGITVGCILRASSPGERRAAYACAVVCAPHREVAQDYLRDRIQAGGRRGGLAGRVERLAAGAAGLMRGELGCAFVEDVDLQMLDDVQSPVAIATEVDQSRERLLYEQALELARGLTHEADFVFGEQGIALTEAAARLLERLVAPLGGVWSSRERREELISLALEAQHLFQRDVDYRVEGEQVIFPAPAPQDDVPAGPDEEIKKLIEVKEGLRLSARREVLARLSVPRFFARYRSVSGVCADARSIQGELWALYSLKTSLASMHPPRAGASVRMFGAAEAKRAALAGAVREASAAGRAVIVAVRRQAEAQAIHAAMQAAGMQPGDELSFALLPPGQIPPDARGRRRSLIVAELPEAARHVARLRRESGAESCALLLSLDEEAVAAGLGRVLGGVVRLAVRPDAEAPPWLAALLYGLTQRAAQRAGRGARLELKARDQMLDDLLAFAGRAE